MQGWFEYIDAGFNVRTVWNSNDIPPDALEVVRFQVDNPPEMSEVEGANHATEVQIEFARVRRMITGEDDWIDDLEFELDISDEGN